MFQQTQARELPASSCIELVHAVQPHIYVFFTELLESQEDVMEAMTVSSDSLCDVLEQENQYDTEQEMMQLVASTPRKSVAFTVDINGEVPSKVHPLGFRADMVIMTDI